MLRAPFQRTTRGLSLRVSHMNPSKVCAETRSHALELSQPGIASVSVRSPDRDCGSLVGVGTMRGRGLPGVGNPARGSSTHAGHFVAARAQRELAFGSGRFGDLIAFDGALRGRSEDGGCWRWPATSSRRGGAARGRSAAVPGRPAATSPSRRCVPPAARRPRPRARASRDPGAPRGRPSRAGRRRARS